jgi:hypothetical protein
MRFRIFRPFGSCPHASIGLFLFGVLEGHRGLALSVSSLPRKPIRGRGEIRATGVSGGWPRGWDSRPWLGILRHGARGARTRHRCRGSSDCTPYRLRRRRRRRTCELGRNRPPCLPYSSRTFVNPQRRLRSKPRRIWPHSAQRLRFCRIEAVRLQTAALGDGAE